MIALLFPTELLLVEHTLIMSRPHIPNIVGFSTTISHAYESIPPTLLMKTTRTAQYAAEAAKSSCRRALVRRDIAAEKRRVKTTRIPIALNVECVLMPKLVTLYIATTGKTSNTKMMLVIIRPTKVSTRALW